MMSKGHKSQDAFELLMGFPNNDSLWEFHMPKN